MCVASVEVAACGEVGRWPGRSGNREKVNKEGFRPVKAKPEKDVMNLRPKEQQP